jgi:hypothetical protein
VKRLVALIAAVAGLTIMLTGCEVTQIDWRNHYYVVDGQSCVDFGALTVKNGSGYTDPFSGLNNGRELEPLRVDVIKTVYGDMNGDGIQDVAVLLRCSYAAAPHIAAQTGYEIQVFTRDGKPLDRLVPPDSPDYSHLSQFVLSSIRYDTTGPFAGHLVTDILTYDPFNLKAGLVVRRTYFWQWGTAPTLWKPTGSFVPVLPTING